MYRSLRTLRKRRSARITGAVWKQHSPSPNSFRRTNVLGRLRQQKCLKSVDRKKNSQFKSDLFPAATMSRGSIKYATCVCSSMEHIFFEPLQFCKILDLLETMHEWKKTKKAQWETLIDAFQKHFCCLCFTLSDRFRYLLDTFNMSGKTQTALQALGCCYMRTFGNATTIDWVDFLTESQTQPSRFMHIPAVTQYPLALFIARGKQEATASVPFTEECNVFKDNATHTWAPAKLTGVLVPLITSNSTARDPFSIPKDSTGFHIATLLCSRQLLQHRNIHCHLQSRNGKHTALLLFDVVQCYTTEHPDIQALPGFSTANGHLHDAFIDAKQYLELFYSKYSLSALAKALALGHLATAAHCRCICQLIPCHT